MSQTVPEVGSILKGKVTGISKFGAFVALDGGKSGLVHISEISNDFVQDINDHLKVGQEVSVKVVAIDEKNRISLSIKKAISDTVETKKQPVARYETSPRPAQIEDKPQKRQSFEDMMSRFKQESDERNADYRSSKEARKNDYEKRNKH